MLRVSYTDLLATLVRVLLKIGFDNERAARCAQLFAESSRDGVYSHGLNRFPLFVSMAQSGIVDIHAQPELVSSSGALERWDGRVGVGNLNAYHCMDRAIALARLHGVGCVALANTNHWMRGGTYGWQAAEAGVIAICWTNTCPNLPPWGARQPRVGNNPLVIAVPIMVPVPYSAPHTRRRLPQPPERTLERTANPLLCAERIATGTSPFAPALTRVTECPPAVQRYPVR